jgi:hypothetical protein
MEFCKWRIAMSTILKPYSIGSAFNANIENGEYTDFDNLVDKLKLTEHLRTNNKKAMRLLFPCNFTGTKKTLENVGDFGAIFLDIDNHKAEGQFSFDDAKRLITSLGLSAIIYTTFSHNFEINRFRIIIPSAHKIRVDRYIQIQKWFYKLISNDDAFDHSTIRNPVLGFFAPSCSLDSVDHKLIRIDGNDFRWTDFDDKIIEAAEWYDFTHNREAYMAQQKLENAKSGKAKLECVDAKVSGCAGGELITMEMHRRDRLLKVLGGEFRSGQTDEEYVAQRLIDYDFTYHRGAEYGGPYFTDYAKRPEFARYEPIDLARELVAREFARMEKKYDRENLRTRNRIWDW